MAEILIHCNPSNYSHTDPEKDKASVFKKGYVVDIKETGFQWGTKETTPLFAKVIITDGSVSDVQLMISSIFGGASITSEWSKRLNWSVVGNDLTIDGHRVRLIIDNPGATNVAAVTRTQVESYLNNWNAEIFSASTNEVIFDIAIFEDDNNNPGALQSKKFWDLNSVDNLNFTEIYYNSGPGDHRISCNYSNYSSFGVNSSQVAARVSMRGGIIVSNDSELIIFDINRNDVFNVFKEEVRQLLEKSIYKRQFRISEALVDTIMSGGGSVNATLAQLQNYIINQVDEDL